MRCSSRARRPSPRPRISIPSGATKADVEAWLARLGEAERAVATGFFTTIRRDAAGNFQAVPYSLEYQGELAEMARHLRDAASATTAPSLKAFLAARAAAFASNDYYASDVAWMKLDSAVEPTIGPYEVYEDGWFNYKAAFEAFITVRDDAETAKLERFGQELQWLEDRLPIDPAYRRKKLGGLAPMRVVNVVFGAGDGNHDVQTAAYNLPNDERIVAEMGSKRMMLKNYQQAKFDNTLLPISKVALAGEDQAFVDFDAFFTHILMHEVMHGLGPTNTGPQGTGGGVRPGAARALQHDRGSQGRHLGPVGAAEADGQGRDRPCRRAAHVHDLPRLGVSHAALRHG